MFKNVSDWFKPVAPYKVNRGHCISYYRTCCGVPVRIDSSLVTRECMYYYGENYSHGVMFWDLAAAACYYISQGLDDTAAFYASCDYFNSL